MLPAAGLKCSRGELLNASVYSAIAPRSPEAAAQLSKAVARTTSLADLGRVNAESLRTEIHGNGICALWAQEERICRHTACVWNGSACAFTNFLSHSFEQIMHIFADPDYFND